MGSLACSQVTCFWFRHPVGLSSRDTYKKPLCLVRNKQDRRVCWHKNETKHKLKLYYCFFEVTYWIKHRGRTLSNTQVVATKQISCTAECWNVCPQWQDPSYEACWTLEAAVTLLTFCSYLWKSYRLVPIVLAFQKNHLNLTSRRWCRRTQHVWGGSGNSKQTKWSIYFDHFRL